MTIKFIENIGTTEVFLTTIFLLPYCFPLFGVLFTTFEQGIFELFGGWTTYVFLSFVILPLIGFMLAYINKGKSLPLLFGFFSGIITFYGYYFSGFNTALVYAGIFGLLITNVSNYFENRGCKTCVVTNGKIIELQSTVTYPNCGHKKQNLWHLILASFFTNVRSVKKLASQNKEIAEFFILSERQNVHPYNQAKNVVKNINKNYERML